MGTETQLPWFVWVVFNLFIIGLLALDLGVFQRRTHAIKIKEALWLSLFWISLALLFNGVIYFWLGHKPAMEFLTGYLIEKSLSVDNLFVFLIIFKYFHVPAKYQHKILFWGILGALIMRAIFIFAGVAIINRFHWTIYILGVFLIYTGVKLAFQKGDAEVHPEKNPILPALALVAATLASIPRKNLWQSAEYRFFGVLLVSVWGAAFIFEPKLGMPRDWDLFTFAGLPLAAFGAFLLLDDRVRPPQYTTTAILATVIAVLSLAPRVASQYLPITGFAQVDSYARLDPVKNKNLRIVTRDYFLEQGDTRAARLEEAKWAAYPEEGVLKEADTAVKEGRNGDAITLYRQAIALNPLNIPSYVYLGQLLNRFQQFDSSIQVMEIARGLAPRNPGVSTTLGLAYWYAGRKAEGESLCRFAIQLDPGLSKPYYYLANMCKETGQAGDYETYLAEAVSKIDATAPMFADMANLEATRRDFASAALNYRKAIDRGLDSSVVREQIERYPQLKELLPSF